MNEQQRERLHQLISQHKEIVALKEKQNPTVLIQMTLLDIIRSLSNLGIIDNIRDSAKAVERLHNGRLPFETFTELHYLLVIATKALRILESENLQDMELMSFTDLSFSLLEVGKRLPILSSLISHDIGIEETLKYSTYSNIQDVLHKQKSGEGGQKKAARARENKTETIKPLLDKLERLRFSGKYKTYKKAVFALLLEDEFQLIAEAVCSVPSTISEKFLMKEAKKVWEKSIRPAGLK